MENDRYNRDNRRNDYGTENARYGGGQRGHRNDWSREDNRRDYGSSGNFHGSSRDDYRDDYGSRGGSSFNADRGTNVGQSGGGYDEWSRGGTRDFADRYSSAGDREAFRGGRDRGWGGQDHGYDRERSFRDQDRFYGGQAGPSRWSSGQPYGGAERGFGEGGRGFWDKASDEVSSWLGDRDAERRRDQDQHRGRGPKGYARPDERIRDDVNDRLTDDGWLDASNVEVAVSDREVTLSGTVTDRNAKRRAEDLAEGVSGVSHVQNNIRIKRNEATGTDVDVDRSDNTGVIAKAGAGGMR